MLTFTYAIIYLDLDWFPSICICAGCVVVKKLRSKMIFINQNIPEFFCQLQSNKRQDWAPFIFSQSLSILLISNSFKTWSSSSLIFPYCKRHPTNPLCCNFFRSLLCTQFEALDLPSPLPLGSSSPVSLLLTMLLSVAHANHCYCCFVAVLQLLTNWFMSTTSDLYWLARCSGKVSSCNSSLPCRNWLITWEVIFNPFTFAFCDLGSLIIINNHFLKITIWNVVSCIFITILLRLVTLCTYLVHKSHQ